MKAIYGTEKFVSRCKAEDIINDSALKAYEKTVMLLIMDRINTFNGLYGLEKAIADENIHVTSHFGNLKTFKSHWLKKFKKLGIQPVTIPDVYGIDEIPCIYDLLPNN